ncbi:MAG: DUF3341 domain-containing protein [Chloroflexi bacterium]|nr:DUF3341 domain-containing protein [Chloroflexota bacterium]
MARKSILGLYETPDAGADALDGLHAAGIEAHDTEVLTGTPYPEGAFGEHVPQHRLFRFPAFGAVFGFTLALLYTAGTQLAWPLVTGGKPILAVPAMLIILYEFTMLNAVIFTVVGIIFESRLPNLFSTAAYDRRISEGLIGVVVSCEDNKASEVESVLRRAGALEIKTA